MLGLNITITTIYFRAARREVPESGKRSLMLKGIEEPVAVASIPWR